MNNQSLEVLKSTLCYLNCIHQKVTDDLTYAYFLPTRECMSAARARSHSERRVRDLAMELLFVIQDEATLSGIMNLIIFCIRS